MKQLLLLLFLPFATACQQVKQDPPPPATSLPVAPKPTEGIVFFSNDAGRTWQNHSEGIPKDIFLTDLVAKDGVVALSTKQHGIFVYSSALNKWQSTPQGPRTEADVDALVLYKDQFFAGTHGDGIFVSLENERAWQPLNMGLDNLSIRKFVEIEGELYAGTNEGLYKWNNSGLRWQLLFGPPNLQVNGITATEEAIYIGTNQGVYATPIGQNNWKQILPDRSVHNISAIRGKIYAMLYNELFVSLDQGTTWQSDQDGIPDGKYTFQVVPSADNILAGQWDGIYHKNEMGNWELLMNAGLPQNAAITEMNVSGNIIVSASSQWIKD